MVARLERGEAIDVIISADADIERLTAEGRIRAAVALRWRAPQSGWRFVAAPRSLISARSRH
jgi:hypothetical protein